MFTFTALLGAQSSSPASQSLLELDGGIKILVDVGWDDSFDASKLQEIERHVSTLSVVLLTHATIEHIGAYAHCCKHIPGFSRIPCYATTPVVNLGRTLMLDLYGSSPHAASFIPQDGIYSSPGETASLLLQAPTVEEIGDYFSLINSLKFSQPHQPIPSPFSPPLAGLTITAYSAGHTLGGTIWHIQHGLESIVYASDWNLGRENFFPGAAWLSSGDGGEVLEALHRPTALICSSRGVERTDALPRRDRDSRLISLIRETIAQGGKVLLPTDSAARVLELAYILNSNWRENMDGPHADAYRNAKIYMASKSSTSTVRYLQSMLEWMDDGVVRHAEAAMTRGEGQGSVANPLNWSYVKQIEKKSQVERALSRNKPCVMLASDASLEWGFSAQTLQALASDSKNLVIMAEEASQVGSGKKGVGRQLWEFYKGQQSDQSGAKIVNTEGLSIEMREGNTEPLSAEENQTYQQYLARQRQMHSTLQGDNTINDGTTADLGDDQASESSESSDEDEDEEHQGRAFNVSAQLTQGKRKIGLTDAELGVNVLLRGKSVHDYDVRNKRGREKMFPFVAHRNRKDDFGEVIKPEDYLRAEERDEVDGVDMKDGRPTTQDGAALGQKRKWDEITATDPRQRGRKEKIQNKKPKMEPLVRREPDDIDALIARATGEDGSGGGAPLENGGPEDSGSESEESEYEPEEAGPDGPQKLIFTTHTIKLNLRIAYVDFSGLYRLTDLQGLIGRINPRKLIVTAGDANETQLLADTCKEAENGSAVGEIFTPVLGETVDASVDTNAWTVKLTRQLVKRLNWKELGTDKPSIAAVSGLLGTEAIEESIKTEEDEGSTKKRLKLAKNDQKPEPSTQGTAMPILDLLGAQYQTHQRAAQPVHVGDLRLQDIRAAIQAQGHNADLRGGGTLLVDGTVIVRKSPTTGGIEIESANAGIGAPALRDRRGGIVERDGTFYAVRRAIYDRLAVVTGA
jgi:cleavage and polyadenylation specificity factor subunit 2